jgi:hypothetical protein
MAKFFERESLKRAIDLIQYISIFEEEYDLDFIEKILNLNKIEYSLRMAFSTDVDFKNKLNDFECAGNIIFSKELSLEIRLYLIIKIQMEQFANLLEKSKKLKAFI